MSSASSSSASDDGASAWVSDIGGSRTVSLFDSKEFSNVQEALEHDKTQGYDLVREGERLGLDLYGRMRLVNLIRRDSLSIEQAKALTSGDWAKDDSLLKPVLEDDPMLQLDFDWSDDEEVVDEVARLRIELEAARNVVKGVLGDDEPVEVKRDDDTHYFDSYAENDIHEIMLRDTTRTVSYAKYILSCPKIKGGVVMDVGCGTGILSMLAARAGAKKVYAIEASGLASKARENIRNNGLQDTIEVIQGKVEDIKLDAKVDVIISEWMGYMLLYESMLDSVLHARDRFLQSTGEMVPARTRLLLSAITGERLWADRMTFWEKVYGFDMTAMRGVYLKDGIVDTVDAKEIVTDEYDLRTVDSHTATPKSLDLSIPFKLTAERDDTIRAFLTHFDTFFGDADIVDTTVIGDDTASEVAPAMNVSFTTGPRGKETHWKQVAFLLDTPIVVKKGDVIEGHFSCKKSESNSRELDVGISFGSATKLYRVR